MRRARKKLRKRLRLGSRLGAQSANITRFIRTAKKFCALIETSGSHERPAFFKDCFRLVTKLLSEIADLPDVGKLRTGRQVTNDESHEIRQRLQQKVGESDNYKMVFDPWKTEEAIYGSISEDLAGIWRDLKNGLLVLKKDDASNAICEWRFSFFFHWGPHHASHLLRPLFSLAFKEELEP